MVGVGLAREREALVEVAAVGDRDVDDQRLVEEPRARLEPDRPAARVAADQMATSDGVEVKLGLPKGKKPWQWLVRTQSADGWKTAIVPGDQELYMLKSADGAKPQEVIVSAVSRLGREGKSDRVEVRKRN